MGGDFVIEYLTIASVSGCANSNSSLQDFGSLTRELHTWHRIFGNKGSRTGKLETWACLGTREMERGRKREKSFSFHKSSSRKILLGEQVGHSRKRNRICHLGTSFLACFIVLLSRQYGPGVWKQTCLSGQQRTKYVTLILFGLTL